MKFIPNLDNPLKVIFIVWALVICSALPIASLDAGITEDEAQHLEHGQKIYAWYFGNDTTAIQSPFDENGQWKYVTEGVNSTTAINIYGGFFDLLAQVIHNTLFKTLDEFESKHILSAFFGALLFILIGLITQRISDSWGVALLAIVIATFTPRLFGYSLSNPKDIPLATFFAFSLLQLISFIKELPKIRVVRCLLIALSFAFALAVRTGAIILIFYFLLFLCFYFALQFFSGAIDKKQVLKTIAIAALISIVGYLATSLFWPWAMANPIVNPIQSLLVFRRFNLFFINELFEGQWIGNMQLPWYFVPKWLYVTLPVTVISGLALFFILLPKFIKKENWQITAYGLLLFSIVFPVLSIILNHSNIYNSARHITFVIPGIVVIASLAWAEVFKQVKDVYLRISIGVAFLVIIAEPVLFIFNNHPLQAMYFSPLMGGTKAAFKNYEMDYWGVSVRSAFEWIEQNDTTATEQNKARVRMWYGEQKKLSHFVEKSKRFTHVMAREESTEWDYSIQLVVEGKHNQELVYHWPPKGTVYQVLVDGAPLCAVVKNFRLVNPVTTTNAPIPVAPNNPNNLAGNFFNEGIAFYNQRNYNNAIVAFKKSLALAPQNLITINNLVASYNELKMYDEALIYGKKGLAIDSKYMLLKNNLRETEKAKAGLQPDANYYVNLSYNFYVQQDFEKCIVASKKILQYDASSFLAWNNICSAYNSLNEYEKAMEACNNGLKLAPTNDLLKNNKAVAVQALKK